MRYANPNQSFNPLYGMLATLTDGFGFGRAARPVARRGAAQPSLLGRAVEVLATWRERHRQRAQLLQLDDHLLRDIGLNRGEAEAEWHKGFWRP